MKVISGNLVVIAAGLVAFVAARSTASEQVPSRQSGKWFYQEASHPTSGRYYVAFTTDTGSPYGYSASIALTYFPTQEHAIFALKAPGKRWPDDLSVSYSIDTRTFSGTDVMSTGQVLTWAAMEEAIGLLVKGQSVTIAVSAQGGRTQTWVFSLSGFSAATKEMRAALAEAKSPPADSGAKDGGRAEWPELSVDELDTLSRVTGKAVSDSLTGDDLAALRTVMMSYTTRIKRPLPAEDLEFLSQGIEQVYQYNAELGRCLLHSIDSNGPFVSERLRELGRGMVETGARQSKIDADIRMVVASAQQEDFEDEFNEERAPPSRAEVLQSLRHLELIKANLVKFNQVAGEVARESRRLYPGDR